VQRARWVIIQCDEPGCKNQGKEKWVIQYWNYKGHKWAFLECPECNSRSLRVTPDEEFWIYKD
jgi:Zn finger protein HypA/HybF involved in hydrogenase expression